MKSPVVSGRWLGAIVLASSLNACSLSPQSTKSQGQLNQAQQVRQMVDGALKLNKELGISGPASNTNQTGASAAKPAMNFVDPRIASSFANLAKLYDNRAERQAENNASPSPQSNQEKLAEMQRFLGDQSECTMAFAFQMQGNYKQAAEVMQRRIAHLEATNQNGSKSHTLALSYAQCADYLNHLGRSFEAEALIAKARALEPNHY